jgi:hypothetical protein
MTKSLEDNPAFPGYAGQPFRRTWSAEIPIGASGATGTILQAPPAFAAAKNGTGVYDCTNLPPWIASKGKGRFRFGIYSPALTVFAAVVTAYNATNGTMTFKAVSAGGATEPASGDIIWVYFEGESR